MTLTVMLASAAGAFALVITVWLASLRLRDASIIDIFWGVGFIVIGWVCVAVGHGDRDRRLLLAILVTIWGTGSRSISAGATAARARIHATSRCASATGHASG